MTRLAKLGIVVAAAALSVSAQNSINITTTTLPTAIIGLPYPNVALQTTGDPGPMSWNIDGPSNWTVGSSTATTGVFCYKSCGGFSVQEPPGQYTLFIGVNSSSGSGSRSYTLIVENPLQIGTTFLPNANANLAYSTQMQGSGGTGNFLWSIQSGTLPPGIALTDNVKGVLSGTAPGVNGVYPFTVRLQDQVTNEAVTQALSITVVNGIAILTTALPNAILNQAYSVQLQGTGANLAWSLAPGSVLPPNLTLAPNGVLSGAVIATGVIQHPGATGELAVPERSCHPHIYPFSHTGTVKYRGTDAAARDAECSVFGHSYCRRWHTALHMEPGCQQPESPEHRLRHRHHLWNVRHVRIVSRDGYAARFHRSRS